MCFIASDYVNICLWDVQNLSRVVRSNENCIMHYHLSSRVAVSGDIPCSGAT